MVASTPEPRSWDAVVVGAGPNGLTAAVTLARRDREVLVLEANDTVGGCTRTAELTLPGFRHDVGSAIHPLGVGSPVFRDLPLDQYGLEWVHPDVPLAHPLGTDRAVVLQRSLDATADALGPDTSSYHNLLGPFVSAWRPLMEDVLRPMLRWPSSPGLMARFGLQAVRPARDLAEQYFTTPEARALFGGIAAHSMLSLQAAASSSYGLVLGVLGHAVGWPMPRGGAGAITRALARYLRSLGGAIRTGRRVEHLDDLPPCDVVLCDVTPRQLLQLSDELPPSYRERLADYRYGPAAFKLDYVLDGPVPWQPHACRGAGTVHLGGSWEQLLATQETVARGSVPENPFVLLAQPTRFDPTRSPDDRQIVWAYCHVPLGCEEDMTEAVEERIGSVAPGFRDRIVRRRVWNPADLKADNPNRVDGDINGGSGTLAQMLARPVLARTPYRTPVDGLYLCSASTPPGGGVHGMCGYHAARAVLVDQHGG